MIWQEAILTLTPFVLAITILIALGLYYLLRRRATRHAHAGTAAFYYLAGAAWALTDLLYLASEEHAGAVFWLGLQSVADIVVSTAWLVHVARYTGRDRWLTRRAWVLLSAAIVIVMALVSTNSLRALMWRPDRSLSVEPFSNRPVDYGGGYVIFSLYLFGQTLVASWLLLQMPPHAHRSYRRLLASMLLITYLPDIAIVIHILGWRPYPQFFAVPWALVACGMLGVWNTFAAGQDEPDELDQLVQERTAELVDTNDMLVQAIAERRRAESLLAREAQDLARSNALLASLSQVATRVAATTEPKQIMRTLGKEFEALGLSCYVIELDPTDRAMVIRYVSVKPPALKRGENALGQKLFGIRIPYERWIKYEEGVHHNAPVFVDSLVSMAVDVLALPRSVVSRAARMAGISPETLAIHLPLVIAEHSRGVLVVWGGGLEEQDIPALEVFANQVAVTIENAGLYERERQQSAQLARSNTFIAALSRVAARVASARELGHVLETLGAELKQIDVTCMVALMEPDRQSMIIHYTSIESGVLAAAEKLLGASMVGFPMRKKRCPFWTELVERGEAYFVGDAVELAAASMPGLLKPVIAQAFRLGGWSADDFVIWLPLSAGSRIEGGLAVWGPDLHKEDMPTLSVFASQVGITIENVRLYSAERQRAEENEVLLKEVHHRVKNNLQVVSSLLRLQSSYIDDDRVFHALAESQDRIRSMALVHEKLYQSSDLSRVDFGDYVRDLAAQILGTYCASATGIALSVEVEDIALDIDRAVACGLILNELLSNALKHAFPDDRTGQVSVEMHAQRGQIRLLVSDDGIGLPDDLDVEQAESLGLELVHALVQQLDGTLSIENRDGCTVSIRFAAD